jgi:hypothetical protein
VAAAAEAPQVATAGAAAPGLSAESNIQGLGAAGCAGAAAAAELAKSAVVAATAASFIHDERIFVTPAARRYPSFNPIST